jgi:predicted membrane channel-forming protein YqfA (hemolysin III family)
MFFFIFTGILLAFIGWGGLATLIIYTLPTIGPRWLFYFLFLLALSGSTLPFIAFLHRRFPSNPPVEGSTVLRQATWFGIFGCLLVWLQMGKVLTFNLGLFIFFGFIIIEFLLRLRESSRWKPKGHHE